MKNVLTYGDNVQFWKTEVRSTSECGTAGWVAPIPGATVMGDRGPLSLVVEGLPCFTSLHSSLDTNPSQNWSQMKLNQNPRHSTNYSFPLFLLLGLLHFYFSPVLLRYVPGEVDGNPLQYSCLENPMDRGAWQAIVHRVTKSQTPLSMHACMHWV